jgi:stage III sporulation protein AH
MIRLKRNQVIISALVVMVAVAGYLSVIDRAGDELGDNFVNLTDGNEVSALIFDDMLGDVIVSNIPGSDRNAIDGNYGSDPGAAVFVNSSRDSSYFVQAKLNREQARSNQKQLLTDVINNAHLEREQKADAASELLKIQNRIEMETAAEALIEAKGFKEVYVRVGDDSVDVVVNKADLTGTEVAQIEDIVRRKTGYSVEQIQISPLSGSVQ